MQIFETKTKSYKSTFGGFANGALHSGRFVARGALLASVATAGVVDLHAEGNPYEWATGEIHSANSFGLPNLVIKPILSDHTRQIIGTGTLHRFDVAQAILQLMEGKGVHMEVQARGEYSRQLEFFSEIDVLDFHVAYSIFNKTVTTVLVLPRNLAFTFTYFEEDPSELAFTLEAGSDTILAGVGDASDVARSLSEFIQQA